MLKHRILVCGGRNYADFDKFNSVMNYLKQWFDKDFCIIQGGARGADRLAASWAFFEGCPMLEMRANWDYYGKKAGSIRNTWMLQYANPDLVIAFPGGTGTRNMLEQAKCWQIDTYKVE